MVRYIFIFISPNPLTSLFLLCLFISIELICFTKILFRKVTSNTLCWLLQIGNMKSTFYIKGDMYKYSNWILLYHTVQQHTLIAGTNLGIIRDFWTPNPSLALILPWEIVQMCQKIQLIGNHSENDWYCTGVQWGSGIGLMPLFSG